jgi:hypothetical protein
MSLLGDTDKQCRGPSKGVRSGPSTYFPQCKLHSFLDRSGTSAAHYGIYEIYNSQAPDCCDFIRGRYHPSFARNVFTLRIRDYRNLPSPDQG